jgi:paraquat-inducible protein B
MNTQANKTLIGAFVVGAVVLIVAGVLIFGGGQFMKKSQKYVLFFQGSVKGLNVGASVLFRGVKIGSVKSITLEADAENMVIYIPVIIEIDPDRIHLIRGERDSDANMPVLLKRGLRAQLTSGSFVTGQLLIELEFHPDTPLKLVGLQKNYPEIPTIPSSFDLIFDKLKDLNFDKIVNELLSAIGALEKVLNSPEIPEILHSLRMTVDEARNLVKKLDSQVNPMVKGINETVRGYGKLARDVDGKVEPLASSVDATLKDARKLVRNVDGRVKPLASSIEKSLTEARTALEQARKSLVVAEKTVGKESPVIYQLDKTLKEISRMARSIRSLADYLERHPNALLYGKGKPKRR